MKTSMLTLKEKMIFEKLKLVDKGCAWGEAIKLVVSDPAEHKIRQLIEQLQSQCLDSPEVGEKIVGMETLELLLDL